MKISSRIISRIGRHISAGQPMWGLLLANEYLSSECDLRQAFVKKALSQMGSAYYGPGKSIQKIISGATLSELDREAEDDIRAERVPAVSFTSFKPGVRNLLLRHVSLREGASKFEISNGRRRLRRERRSERQ